VLDVWFGALRHGYRFARMLQADVLKEKGYHLAAQALRLEPVVACGDRGLAVTPEGRVVTWGRPPGRSQNRWYVRKPGRLLRDVRAVAAGEAHYLALTGDGRVLAWGDNLFGRCSVPADLPPVEAVSASYYHSLVLTADGRVVAWGYDEYGQLDVPPDLPPVVAVAATNRHSLALTADGDVVAWGYDRSLEAPSGLKAVAVAASMSHVLAVTPEGRVVAWGRSACGACDVPPDLPPVVAVAACTGCSVALTVTGDVVVWGGAGFLSEVPLRDVPPGLKAVAVSFGLLNVFAVTPEGRVVAWGNSSEPLYALPSGLTVRVTPSGTPAGNE